MSDSDFQWFDAECRRGTFVLPPSVYELLRAEYEKRGLEMPPFLLKQEPIPVLN